MNSFDKAVTPYLSFLDNQYVSAILTIILIVYASLAAPRLPENVAALFDNPIVKLILFFLIVYLAKHNATIAIIAAVAVLVSLMTLNKWNMNREMMSVVNSDQAAENLNTCNDFDCSDSEESSNQDPDQPWSNYDRQESAGQPYLEQNPVDNLHPFKQLSEEEQVYEVMNEKARIEDQLQRSMTPEELKNLCLGMSQAQLLVPGIGQNATELLNQEAVEGYDEGNSSSSYASVNA